MSTFVIVAHVERENGYETNETSVLVLKAKLESEGIECFLQGQFRGPMVLKIRNEDCEKAKPILVETGFYKKEFVPPDQFIVKFDELTKNISILENFSTGARLLIVFLTFATISTLAIYFILLKR
jgi:hypothetical protein